MLTTHRQNKFLSVGDPVNWYATKGLNPVPATVIGIELCPDKQVREGENVMVVKWELIDFCIVHFDTGKSARGWNIEPTGATRIFSYPEKERCN